MVNKKNVEKDNGKEEVKKNTDEKCVEDKKEETISKDSYIRLLADFENYKKRSDIEKANVSFFVEQLLLNEFLVIVDDFERLFSASKIDQQKDDGVSLIYRKVIAILNKFDVKKIDLKEGDTFNPDIAESISIQQVDNEESDGKIVKIYENGYNIKDKVLRFAKVVVGKK